VAPEIISIGVDLNPILLQKAQQMSSKKQFSNRISFMQADAQNLPFADLSIDLAVSIASLHQWHNRERGIKELYRVLKNGGVVLILVGAQIMWLFDFFKRNLANRRDIKALFETVGFQDVILAKPESNLLLIYGRK
jgi:ubiquinone/menaquinone biosynthesis C-methylase UbiE